MKIAGVRLYEPNIEHLYLPRGDQVIHFMAKGIVDSTIFDELCPRPRPPKIQKPGQKPEDNFEDDNFKRALDQWGTRRTDWMVIESLRATEDLTWEKVKYDDPGTWHLWREELKEAHFVDAEVNRILNLVMNANALNEARLEEARNSFTLLSQAQQKRSLSQTDGQSDTPPGEPANASA